MKKLLIILLIFYPLILMAEPPVTLTPTPPPINARAYILQDFHSGYSLMKKGVEETIEPASLTKLMTAYIVFEKLQTEDIKLTDKVKVSNNAWTMKGSRMYLEANTSVTIENLLKGMIIQSGNDASVALAEHLAGSEEDFVNLMNERAKTLGMINTHYVNSTGLPAKEHYTTVSDLIKITRALIDTFPSYYGWYSEKEFTYNNITQSNRNLLLWRNKNVDGIKTGYTERAGYCLIASAKQDNMRLISVVVGTNGKKQRADETEKMLDYGFRFFNTYQLYKEGESLNTEKVWKGSSDQLQLGLGTPLYITIPKGQYKQLKATLHINKHISAPVIKGNNYGSIKINLGNHVISEQPLVALHAIELGNWWQQLVDFTLLQFE